MKIIKLSPANCGPHDDKQTRRQFIRLMGVSAVAASVVKRTWESEALTNSDEAASSPIIATLGVNPQNSPAALAQGRYEIRIVPDTVDLVQNAELAINAITRTLDQQKKFGTYFWGNIAVNPPRLVGPPHLFGKFLESLALMRLMTSNRSNRKVDDAWVGRLDQFSRTVKGHTVDGGRILEMLALYYHLTGDAKWTTYGKRIVDRWQKQVGDHGDFAFFPPASDYNLDPTGDQKLKNYKQAVPTGWPGTFSGWALQGLSVYYRETHYRPAGELARRLACYLRYHAGVLSEQGHFLAAHDGYLGPKTALHFHHNSNSALALAEYALATGDKQYAEFARQCYEYGRSVGNSQVGFFPEYILKFPDDRHGVVGCEGCCVADMTALVLKLTEAGVDDYWDDMDCYVRNMLTEMQLKRSRWIYEAVRNKPSTPVDHTKEDARLAAERLVGSFAGRSGANQFQVWGPGIMHCCTGNCSRALYHVWNHMIREEPEQLTMELMLNRDCDMADVKSDLPYAGRLTIVLKKDCHLRIRKPGWLDSATVKMTTAESRSLVSFQNKGAYLVTTKLPMATKLQLAFDLPQRTVKTHVGNVDATITLCGNEVVAFDPPGKIGPYWQDKLVGRSVTPEVERTYFIPEEEVHW